MILLVNGKARQLNGSKEGFSLIMFYYVGTELFSKEVFAYRTSSHREILTASDDLFDLHNNLLYNQPDFNAYTIYRSITTNEKTLV